MSDLCWKRIQKRNLATSRTAYRLVEAFPSIRLEMKTKHALSDGTGEDESSIQILHDKTFTEIRPEPKFTRLRGITKTRQFWPIADRRN